MPWRPPQWYRRHRLLVAVSFFAAATALAFSLAPFVSVTGEESDVRSLVGGGFGWGALVVMCSTLLLGWAFVGVPIMMGLRRHRVGLHTWTSIVALALALLHGVALNRAGLFSGSLSGWVSTGLMAALFVTGWWRPFWVASWGLRPWRWVHWLLAAGAILIGIEHVALLPTH
ncbi:MAG: hypothetical protein ACYDBQ_06340 [Thermoplasmatota archaeon]